MAGLFLQLFFFEPAGTACPCLAAAAEVAKNRIADALCHAHRRFAAGLAWLARCRFGLCFKGGQALFQICAAAFQFVNATLHGLQPSPLRDFVEDLQDV